MVQLIYILQTLHSYEDSRGSTNSWLQVSRYVSYYRWNVDKVVEEEEGG